MNLQQSSSIPALFSDHDFAYDLNEVANFMKYSSPERKLQDSVKKHDREKDKKIYFQKYVTVSES